MDSFVETTNELKRLDEVNDAEQTIKTKKKSFQAWETMVFTRCLDKRKYGELIHDLSIQYEIKRDQYLKSPQELVDVWRKMIFKAENINDKSNTQKQNKN